MPIQPQTVTIRRLKRELSDALTYAHTGAEKCADLERAVDEVKWREAQLVKTYETHIALLRARLALAERSSASAI